MNRRGPHVCGGVPALAALVIDELDRAIKAGAELIDVRPIEAFASGHVPGSLSIALRPSFASWLGWLVPADRPPLVFVLGSEQDRRDLVRQALGIGYDRLDGELAGGIAGWSDVGRALAKTALTTTADPARQVIVDVRQGSEYRGGHIPGALPVELGGLGGPAIADLPPEAAFTCGHGERAMTAASLAERSGRRASVFVGGAEDWARRTGRPLARD